jgi:D-glycero-alpha-D-manno-heptose-7-phosphate kinase
VTNERITTATAPTRIDLAGGWTDVPPYTVQHGGMVLNIAIELRATVTVRDASTAAPPSDALVRAAWQAAGSPAVSITAESVAPLGSGLGGSSAVGVALAAALHAHSGSGALTADALAEQSRHTETVLLGVPGGCQDHYAAAHGGALLLTCGATTAARALTLDAPAIDALESRLRLVYTGASRMSGAMIDAVLSAWQSGDTTVRDALSTMAALAQPMADEVCTGDLDALAPLLRAQWAAQRQLHPGITTDTIDAIERDALAAGAQAIKALGASGGGCVVVLGPRHAMPAIERAIGMHGTLFPWRVARTGVQVSATAVDTERA